jgi:putative phage-type endonuclease
MEQRSPEWFAARKGRITGSSVGAILGLSPFAKPDDIMRRMVRDYHNADPEFKGNVATEWGTYHEPGAITEYEMFTGRTVEPASFYMWEDWLGASPDGFVGEHGLIEVKCPFGLRDLMPPVLFKTAKMQAHYYAQMQIQMFVTNRQWCDFWQWTPRDNYLERVERDDRYLETILRGLKFFYERYLIEREKPEKYLDGKAIELHTEKVRFLFDAPRGSEAPDPPSAA